MTISVRSGGLGDIEEMYALDCASFEFPWTLNDFKSVLLSGTPVILIEEKGKIVAQCVYRTVLDEAEILTLAVAPDARGKGYARLLLEELDAILFALGVRYLFLEVRVSNTRARHVYSSAGFEEIGFRKRYYLTRNGREDAVVMQKALM